MWHCCPLDPESTSLPDSMKPHANTLQVFLLLFWLFFDGPATSSLPLNPKVDSGSRPFSVLTRHSLPLGSNFPSWLYNHLLMTPKSRFLTQISFFEIIPWKFSTWKCQNLTFNIVKVKLISPPYLVFLWCFLSSFYFSAQWHVRS